MATSASRATFEVAYTDHVREVLAFCLRRTNEALAEDATAEVFAVAWRRIVELPEEPQTLPWLYGVAANVLKNQSRSTRRIRNLSAKIGSQAPERNPSPEAQAIDRAVQDEVSLAIASLKPKYRDVLRLVEWEGLTRREVAKVMGVSRATIDQRINRAYQTLARRLNHLFVDDNRGGKNATERTS
ncbi:MAG: RNA polymerase sigma factor [Acidimicrobiales bacterium]